MRKSLLRILILVLAIGIPVAVALFIYWQAMLPDSSSQIHASPKKALSDEKALELYK